MNLIPAITDEMGKYWDQPNSENFLIDDTHVIMDMCDFMGLREYSASNPSGVYPGKMWKRHDGLYDSKCKVEDRRWLLCWFGIVKDRPDLCSNNYREIIIV